MSKAEELSQNRYPTLAEKYAFIDGYEQAEKDLELSWQDIVMIDKLLIDLGMMFPCKSTPNYYQEVLNRFKKGKG